MTKSSPLIRCIAIEDEPLAMERITRFIEKTTVLRLIHTFSNASDALSYLLENKVNLVFLDIKMDEMNGIELLKRSNFSGNVIITSAYSEFAIDGFELNVVDFLLKPYSFGRFEKAIQKVLKNTVEHFPNTLFIKTENRLEKVAIAEIKYIEGMGDYRRIHTKTKKIMTLQTFGQLQEVLPKNQVIRIHKSTMVGINFIDSIERNRVIIEGNYFPISESYKAEFFDLIG